ncbi:hypothetical protein KAX97_15000 [candidate division WOR-3 bacterium]|nr:hypothetical protein [candidate division WOR-3 bacterium]
MKKIIIVLLLLFCVSTAYAKVMKRPFVQIAPKASLYIGSVRFGFGAEVVFNPLRNIGFRMDLTEISFGDGGTMFTLNRGTSFDVLYYLPMRKMQPYVHAGFGFSANGATVFSIRGGMGFDFAMRKGMKFFVEPGIIISSVSVGEDSDTDVMFRLSAGAKFGIF